MASYPGAIYPAPSFGTNMSDTKTQSVWRDEITDEVRAIETENGTTPSGSFATVAARLAAAIRWRGSDAVHSGTGSAFTTVTPDTEVEDTSAIWTSGTNLTIPEAGFYIFTMRVTPASGNTADDILRLTLNGIAYHSAKGAASAEFSYVWTGIASATHIATFAIFNASATRNYAVGITIAKIGIPL